MADIRACHLPQKLTTPFNQMYQMYGVELTMDLNWKHQIQRMTGNLRNKLEALSASYASPRQKLNIYLHCHHSQPCLCLCCNPLHSGRPNHLGQHDM